MPIQSPLADSIEPRDRAGASDPALVGFRPTAGAVEAVQALTRASKAMERASGGLSLAHYRVLAAVAAGDERASRVAARLAVGKPTISASVDALCARGLLVRSGVADDQRAVQLSLTDEGLRVLEEAEAAMAAVLEDLAIRTGRKDAVISALNALGSAVEQAALERRK